MSHHQNAFRNKNFKICFYDMDSPMMRAAVMRGWQWWQELDLDLPEETEIHCTAGREEGLHNSFPPSMCDEVKELFLRKPQEDITAPSYVVIRVTVFGVIQKN